MIIEYTGRTSYRPMWERQKELCTALGDGLGEEHILMVEHDHVYTLGVHGHASNMLASSEMLERRGIECIRIERGGDITYHGPGQAVAYLIIDLRRRHMGVKDFVDALEQSVIDTIALYGIKGERVEGATGVWIGTGTPRERKICAIGVKVRHGITYHGLALNVNTDLSYFSLINPCGFIEKGVTSIALETGTPVDFFKVQKQLADALQHNLDIKSKA